MKILISNNENNIGIIKDFEDMEPSLIAQTIVELKILINELVELYNK